MSTTVPVEKLSAKSFARYGSVIDGSGEPKVPSGDAFSFHDQVGVMNIAGGVSVGLLKVTKRPLAFDQLERHLGTPEMLVAVEGDVIVPVAAATPSSAGPDASTAAAYLLEQGKSIIMSEGVWHWVPFPIEDEATLFVIFRQGTPSEDLEVKGLEAQIRMEVSR